jgi:hypothetical protein
MACNLTVGQILGHVRRFDHAARDAVVKTARVDDA